MITLRNHPFAVEAFFKSSLVLTYAIAKDELKDLIPECLELDTFNDRWAFIAVAMVDTKHLRPKGFPQFMGDDFFLIGFRVFVRYTNNQGKRLRGLYILKSETNKKKMSFFGNIFTHYSYTTTDIALSSINDKISISSVKSGLDIEVDTSKTEVSLPKGSPFGEWKEARRFAGPLPFTFTYNNKPKEILIIEGVRENWSPRPVEVLKSNVQFVLQKGFKHITLANAFIIENVPYYWKKGKIEVWKK
jgi:uncharacterized protein YqjF (DUF2071 family)